MVPNIHISTNFMRFPKLQTVIFKTFFWGKVVGEVKMKFGTVHKNHLDSNGIFGD